MLGTTTPNIVLGLSPDFDFSVLLEIFFLLLLAAYVIYSAVLVYHWQAYGIGANAIRSTLILYFVSTAPLMILLGVIALVN